MAAPLEKAIDEIVNKYDEATVNAEQYWVNKNKPLAKTQPLLIDNKAKM
jgi:hypothetical protein